MYMHKQVSTKRKMKLVATYVQLQNQLLLCEPFLYMTDIKVQCVMSQTFQAGGEWGYVAPHWKVEMQMCSLMGYEEHSETIADC